MILETDDIQARTVLGAMKSIANGGAGGLSEMDGRTIETAGAIAFGTGSVDVASLAESTPEQLAACLKSSEAAEIATQVLAVTSLVGGVLEPQKTQCLRSFAEALSVDGEYLEILDDATSGRIGRATDKLAQRGAEFFLPTGTGETGSDPVEPLMPFSDGDDSPSLEARYLRLGDLPEGTFGRALFDHFRNNNLEFPASVQGQVETFVIPHDSSHVLSGYSTDEEGELLVAAFIGAMHPDKPMESQILPAMFCWHLGIKLSWLGGSYRGAFEPESFWTAWDRGKSMNTDLFDPGWDFWAATSEPLEHVRQSCGVRGIDTALSA